MKISVIGLGKLGACTATCFAYKGYDVIGVDVNKNTVSSINSGKAPVCEPGIESLISKAKRKLKATDDFEYALLNSDISFFIVPTPSKKDGNFSNEHLKSALVKMAKSLYKKNDKHVFVITSTVSPGTTEKSLIPLVENISGKTVNKDFYFCYNPEFIALGSVIKDFLNPDLVLIGESHPEAGNILENIYNSVCESQPYIARMSIISSEIAKISLNSYITMKITFANTLASICNRIPGADVDSITRALGADKRLSPHYIKGGLSYGGPCFPRDNRAFSSFASGHGVKTYMAKATDTANKYHIDDLIHLVLANASQNTIVAVLGLSYKPDTPVIEESASIKLIKKLLEKQLNVIVYDPLAVDNARMVFGQRIEYANTVKECLDKASLCIIAGQHDEFKAITGKEIGDKKITVIDCWRILIDRNLGKSVRYLPYGRSI
jgi:UDPglucose 6-dehydrogenase